MRKLLTEWILSRWIDDGRPLPRRFAGRGLDTTSLRHQAGRLAEVDRALSSAARVQADQPSPFLRGRILASLDTRSEAHRPPLQRTWAHVALSVACVGLLVGGVVLLKIESPPPLGPTPGNSSGAPLTLPRAWLVDDLRRFQDQIVRRSVDERLRQEAQNLVTDSQRAANVVLARFPFSAGDSR
jgi:hypothetical protein